MNPLQVPQASEDVKLKATTGLLLGELKISTENKTPLLIAKFNIGQKVCLIPDILLNDYEEFEIKEIVFKSRGGKPEYKLVDSTPRPGEQRIFGDLIPEQSLVEAKYCDITNNYNK